jgi:hypothetical protein
VPVTRVIIVGHDARLLHMNEAAREIVGAGDGLRADPQCLEATSPEPAGIRSGSGDAPILDGGSVIAQRAVSAAQKSEVQRWNLLQVLTSGP